MFPGYDGREVIDLTKKKGPLAHSREEEEHPPKKGILDRIKVRRSRLSQERTEQKETKAEASHKRDLQLLKELRTEEGRLDTKLQVQKSKKRNAKKRLESSPVNKALGLLRKGTDPKKRTTKKTTRKKQKPATVNINVGGLEKKKNRRKSRARENADDDLFGTNKKKKDDDLWDL